MVRLFLLCATTQVLLAGCGNDLGVDGTTAASTGLPCDVQALLTDKCLSCHGSQLSGGAPIPLVTYSDLTATNSAGVMVAQRCLDRLTQPSAQMPPLPAPAASSAEIATLRAWIAAGTPSGDCASTDPFGGPSVCTSGKTWTGGNRESPLMHPGAACIGCHASSGEGPRFAIAGTVYPTAHEPTDCYGATSASVEVTDAAGKVTTLAVNAAGSFYSSAAIAFPIHVAVVANGVRRPMSAAPPSGDCNTCHTEKGASQAPGRIVLP